MWAEIKIHENQVKSWFSRSLYAIAYFLREQKYISAHPKSIKKISNYAKNMFVWLFWMTRFFSLLKIAFVLGRRLCSRNSNCIIVLHYKSSNFLTKKWSFSQLLWIFQIYPNFEPRFQPKKSLFLKNSTRNFFVSSDHMNIFTHILTCFSSIWDGLKSIFSSLENVTFCINS